MNGLYKKVLKGAYPEIPKKYTKDLADVIMKMLSVDSKMRPNCTEILELEQIQKRIQKLFKSTYIDETIELFTNIGDTETDASIMNKNGLLNTIRIPNNLAQLTKRLPKSKYTQKQQNFSTNSRPARNDKLSTSVTENAINRNSISNLNKNHPQIANSGKLVMSSVTSPNGVQNMIKMQIAEEGERSLP